MKIPRIFILKDYPNKHFPILSSICTLQYIYIHTLLYVFIIIVIGSNNNNNDNSDNYDKNNK